MSPDYVLSVVDVTKTFGSFTALQGMSFHVKKGEILGLVGPNGSGKTTCMNVISGSYRADRGSLHFMGKNIQRTPASKLSHMGMNRTFQIPRPFKGLTVRENLQIAATFVRREAMGLEEIASFIGLEDSLDKESGMLNSTQQKLLDLGRALATGPTLLLVDELGAGMNPHELDITIERLQRLAKQGISMIVVEHLMSFVRQLTERVIVMNAGKEIFEGTLDDAVRNEEVVRVYLGGGTP
ncbi:ABC transporter ATP-binding protein [Ferroacidibacillus organovorans]|uniref:ABC transporter ATP-binding protein n=1 Tax=Ferroacidibacillus organovorans TaxID=1765683 RepID=A0A162T2S3_9BACL|nr:ABC transporter ATP-binding protein [Ferroacidibacillus organovorans]KYP80403.1 ABC transporter ATP-binding protein [Ferroacidibacillus organovorans]OAG93155.1 ABC transporter ATP-binding protein [Ferroacidibacillus organovorans]OPG17251.1 ABC transporter ATP-binding protein [Ferroacidibacillus organovorans]